MYSHQCLTNPTQTPWKCICCGKGRSTNVNFDRHVRCSSCQGITLGRSQKRGIRPDKKRTLRGRVLKSRMGIDLCTAEKFKDEEEASWERRIISGLWDRLYWRLRPWLFRTFVRLCRSSRQCGHRVLGEALDHSRWWIEQLRHQIQKQAPPWYTVVSLQA